jgi:hypothetical protein
LTKKVIDSGTEVFQAFDDTIVTVMHDYVPIVEVKDGKSEQRIVSKNELKSWLRSYGISYQFPLDETVKEKSE